MSEKKQNEVDIERERETRDFQIRRDSMMKGLILKSVHSSSFTQFFQTMSTNREDPGRANTETRNNKVYK